MHNTNKGRTFPPDPLPVEDIVKMLLRCTPRAPGHLHELIALRTRAEITTLWRTGLRVSELMALESRDLSPAQQSIIVRRGKGGRRRIVAMDDWGWSELSKWTTARDKALPPGAVFCVIRGKRAGQRMSTCAVRQEFARLTHDAGILKRGNPHSFRHGFAVTARSDGIDLFALQRQLGHARLDVTEAYFTSIDPMELLTPVSKRPAPTMPIPDF